MLWHLLLVGGAWIKVIDDMTSNAMIVAAQPEAAEAGARVLKRGGNAVDAAMTAALVQGVVDPQMTGIAGFGNCQIFMPGQGVHTCLDFHGKTVADWSVHSTKTRQEFTLPSLLL